jgi:hypothetical protein
MTGQDLLKTAGTTSVSVAHLLRSTDCALASTYRCYALLASLDLLGALTSQHFRPRLTVRVKVWSLANTDSAVTKSLTKTFIVKCGAVKCTTVIPDG